MIIAGFAGVGKTHFCKNTRNAIDFIIMPFKYSNFYQVSQNLSEVEEIKANLDLDFVVGWEEYYWYALLDTFRKYPDEIIVIPTVLSVLEKLKKENIPVTVVYPNEKDKKIYKRRYQKRGNSEEFIKIFCYRWEYWLSSIRRFVSDGSIQLLRGQYLSDVMEPIPYEEDKIIPNKESYIYDTYFKNGLDKGFAETPMGQLMKEFGIYEQTNKSN